MLPATADREVTTSGKMTGTSFGISQKNQAHILSILRDRLYTNKILAVLREYSSNAWDAHIDAGKADVPIKVNLPTRIEPTLYIRDYGKGLSEEDVYEVYAKYGESTKRSTNAQVGMLGIGSKSAFAYSDSFTITSYNGGMKKVYVAVLDATDMGVINKMFEEPCDESETGVEIRLPVRPDDVQRFHAESAGLFQYFSPLPDINMSIQHLTKKDFKAGFLLTGGCGHSSGSQWIAVMGCVPYRLNLSSLPDKTVSLRAMEAFRGGLYLPIGSVDVSANREELEYTERTISAIKVVMASLIEELEESYDAIAAKESGVSKYRAIRSHQNITGYPCPNRYHKYLQTSFAFPNPRGRPWPQADPPYAELQFVAVHAGFRTKLEIGYVGTLDLRVSRIVICDDTANLRKKPYIDPLCCPELPPKSKYIDLNTKVEKMVADGKRVPKLPMVGTYGLPTYQEVYDILFEFLTEHELQDDIKIVPLSSIPIPILAEDVEDDKALVPVNIKHRKKTFVLNLATKFSKAEPSAGWELTSQAIQPSDPVLLLDKFRPINRERKHLVGIFDRISSANTIFSVLFGYPLPPIYGVKLSKKVQSYSDVGGEYYHVWVANKFKELAVASPDVRAKIEGLRWRYPSDGLAHLANRLRNQNISLQGLKAHLPKGHPLLQFLIRLANAPKTGLDLVQANLALAWAEKAGMGILDQPLEEYTKLLATYPLLGRGLSSYSFGTEVTENAEAWAEYFLMIDVLNASVAYHGLREEEPALIVEEVPTESEEGRIALLELTSTTVDIDTSEEEEVEDDDTN